ncbi:hypothetical protein [Acetobacter papayae]|nr:hypothetical protein [Acetobacter papayae]
MVAGCMVNPGGFHQGFLLPFLVRHDQFRLGLRAHRSKGGQAQPSRYQ